jgi:hypothetical protein
MPLAPFQLTFDALPDYVQAVFVAFANGVQADDRLPIQGEGQAFGPKLLASHAPKLNRMYGIDKGIISYVRYGHQRETDMSHLNIAFTITSYINFEGRKVWGFQVPSMSYRGQRPCWDTKKAVVASAKFHIELWASQ